MTSKPHPVSRPPAASPPAPLGGNPPPSPKAGLVPAEPLSSSEEASQAQAPASGEADPSQPPSGYVAARVQLVALVGVRPDWGDPAILSAADRRALTAHVAMDVLVGIGRENDIVTGDALALLLSTIGGSPAAAPPTMPA